MRIRRVLALALALLALFALCHAPGSRFWRAGRLLLALSTPPAAAAAVIETELTLPGRDGPIRARLYQRADAPRAPGLVIGHGVHFKGINEGRLVPFARELARAGRTVLTPELRDLTEYRITQQGERILVDSVSYLSAKSEWVSGPRVGLLGFSFAGGLSLVAAGRPELEGKLDYVTSVGGHHDMARVLRFLISHQIETPHGVRAMKAHDYGLVVVVLDNIEHFVDEADQSTLARALRLWLHDDRASARALASERTTASGERLFGLLEAGRLAELGPKLSELVSSKQSALAELSPGGRLKDIGVPVYLLHGSHDSVIPASEVEWADLELGSAPHQALISPLLRHVEVDKSGSIGEELALVDLMAKML
ncbi:MAG: hypothetical protein IPI67_33970 [Myxococcales bacterium]|nr:hypothetical protein [Myxococcales bacterium]